MTTSARISARSKIVSILAGEILNSEQEGNFLIDSEHQLCRRFNNSRVTIRLALADLENKGLIYRKHGKGTFAHGRSTRPNKAVGILMKSPDAAMHWSASELIRGLQSRLAASRVPVVFINMPVENWQPEMANLLGSILVFDHKMTSLEIEALQNRKLPYLIVGQSEMEGPQLHLGYREAARVMTERLLMLGHERIALLTGPISYFTSTQRAGIHDALKSVGINPSHVPEFSCCDEQVDKLEIVRHLLDSSHRTTAVIAFDDNLAQLLSLQARRGMNLEIPKDLSVISLQQLPYVHHLDPILTTVRFDSFSAGQSVATALMNGAQQATEITDISFAPIYIPGQTVAAPRAK